MSAETTPIAAHGGTLVSRVIAGEEHRAALELAAALPSLTVDARNVADLELIATGAYRALKGFIGFADCQSLLHDMRLANGVPWSLPINLRVSDAKKIRDTVALEASDGWVVALFQVREVFTHSKEEEAQLAYGTTDPNHPGVAQLYGQGDFLVGGDIRLLRRTAPTFPELALDPADTRRAFAERGWRTVVGFQTRNPAHPPHEHIPNAALATVDGLLLHPHAAPTN